MVVVMVEVVVFVIDVEGRMGEGDGLIEEENYIFII